jgi:glycosyltransferase involved in cell wall biosynthesis
VEDLPMDKFRFHFVGGGSFVKDIQELSQSFNNVIYYGYIKDEHILADIYRKADVLLLPSRKGESWEELFGLVIIEAMACGAVVMSTDHIGPKELIVNNYNGFIFPEEKFVESASQELLKLYSERLRLEEMRRNSINFSKKFSEKEISKRWDIILRNYLE